MDAGTWGTVHQHICALCGVGHVWRVGEDAPGHVRGGEASRPVFALHRRDRRHYAEAGECTARDGEADCGTVLDLHGW